MAKRVEVSTELTAQELHEKYWKAKDLVEQNHWHIHRAESPLRHFIYVTQRLKQGNRPFEAFLYMVYTAPM